MEKIDCPNCEGEGIYLNCQSCGGVGCAVCTWTDGDDRPSNQKNMKNWELEDAGICCCCSGSGKITKERLEGIKYG